MDTEMSKAFGMIYGNYKNMKEKNLPCPHARPSWKMCPHCLGINQPYTSTAEKKYQVIYADPPWELKAGSPNLHEKKQGNRELIYPTMTIQEIKDLPVKNISDNNSVLFLWTTNKYIELSYSVARAWGFEPSTMLVWCKKPKGRGLGGTFGISTEYLLFCRRGSHKAISRHWSTWFEAKRGKHSEKPQIARDIIEKCFDGNKIELFARKKESNLLTKDWDVWGNEVESDIHITA